MELRELSENDGRDIFDMLQEIGPGENGFVNSAYEFTFEQFPDYARRQLDVARGVNLQDGFVPQTIYWLMAWGKPVGMGKLRHYLNDNLRKHGGHIGYTVRPSERGKGYGKTLLKELLKQAAGKNIPDVLLTCNEANARSRRVIETNGGLLESVTDGQCKYWIELRYAQRRRFAPVYALRK